MPLALRRHLPTALIALGAILAAPSAAGAGSYDFGSELTSPANAVESHSADTVYWDGAGAGAPASGQLRYVTIRGGVLPGGGNGEFRFVVLHPDGAGVKVEQIDQRIRTLPTTTDPMRRVPNKDYDWPLCLHKGDHLGLWKVGHGNLQIFGAVPGSITRWYENASGLARGNVFTGAASPDRELLMRILIMTGPDATSRCPGGYRDHLYRGLDLVGLRLVGQRIKLRARCPAATYGGCFGRLSLRVRTGGRRIVVGGARFTLPSGRRFEPHFAISPELAALIRRRGSIRGEVFTTGHDDPSDARNLRAPAPRPGRQSHTGTTRVVIKAAG